jgi:hypothetical protein
MPRPTRSPGCCMVISGANSLRRASTRAPGQHVLIQFLVRQRALAIFKALFQQGCASKSPMCVLPRCYPGTRKVVGAAGFEPTTPCAQGRCATRLRYAPTRQEYSENDARRHQALRRRGFVALCVAPCGAFRRGQANLARSRNDSGGGSELTLLQVVRTSGTCRRSRRPWSSARSTSSCGARSRPFWRTRN